MSVGSPPGGMARLQSEIVSCRKCPRLVAWREEVARVKRASFADEEYWGRPVPSFGDPEATVLVLGLAPAAHGGNRTGRIFTGDRSGDWLFGSLYRVGVGNQPEWVSVDYGLKLHGCWVTAAVHCAPPANKPTPLERDTCLPYAVRELALLAGVRVIVCLGAFAWDGALRVLTAAGATLPRPRPKFGHAAEATVGARVLLGCYHPSQQNTFTGKLTRPMIDDVMRRALELGGVADPR